MAPTFESKGWCAHLDPYLSSAQARTNVAARNLVGLAVELNRIARADLSALDVAQGSSQRVLLAYGTVRIVAAGRHHGNRLVPPNQEFRFQVGIGLLQGFGAGHPQAFHQTVLRRLKTAFYSALGLSRQLRLMGTS